MRPKHSLSFQSASPQATRQIAQALTPFWQVGDVVLLSGELGAGKTGFMKGVAQGLGICGPVASPTFALSHHYSIAETDDTHNLSAGSSPSAQSVKPSPSALSPQSAESSLSAQSSQPTKSQLNELRHIDLYRLDDPTEMLDYIWEELEVAAVFVEWGNRLPVELFDSHLEVKLQFGELDSWKETTDTRTIELIAVGKRWDEVWNQVEAATSQLRSV